MEMDIPQEGKSPNVANQDPLIRREEAGLEPGIEAASMYPIEEAIATQNPINSEDSKGMCLNNTPFLNSEKKKFAWLLKLFQKKIIPDINDSKGTYDGNNVEICIENISAAIPSLDLNCEDASSEEPNLKPTPPICHYNLISLDNKPELLDTMRGIGLSSPLSLKRKNRGRKSNLSKAQAKAKHDVADDFPLTILNIYGPCQGRVPFWNDLMSNSIVKFKNMVLGGDLNFSIGSAEAWGPSVREDSPSDFFQNILISNNLIDVNLIKLKPTWRNRRVGEARVAKRLDRFLINKELSSRIPMFRQWVEEGGPSDHFPIFLELSKPPPKPLTPFKFNASWLQEDSFNKLFKETWRHLDRSSTEDKGFLFMENLKRLKKATIEWAKVRKTKHNEEITRISEELQRLESTEEDGYASQESKERILFLEKLKNQIHLAKEEEWRLKSRAV